MNRLDNERNRLAIARMALHLPDKLPDSLIRKLEDDVEVLQALLADHARLKAVVEKLPKTADGVPVVPGMELWVHGSGDLEGITVPQNASNYVWLDGVERYKGSGLLQPHLCYSTRQAARDAAAGGEASRD